MLQILEVVFDATTLHPTQPLDWEIGTKVQITVESPLSKAIIKSKSFLQTARSMQLEGATHWSENLDQYVYGAYLQH